MKFNYTLIILLTLFLFSCSKSNLNDQGEEDKQLVFNLDFYTESVNHLDLSKSSSLMLPNYFVYTDGFRVSGDLYAEVNGSIVAKGQHDLASLENASQTKVSKVSATFPGATGNYPEGTRVALEKGVAVKVLVFDDRDRFIGSETAFVGNRTTITIRPKDLENTSNRLYRMVAFSYNTKDDKELPSYDVNNTNMEMTLPTDREFLYYNGDISSTGGIHTLVLRPLTSKVGVTVNGRAINAKVKKIKGAFGGFSYKNIAVFDLRLNSVVRELGEETNMPLTFDIGVANEQDSLSVNRYFYLGEGSTQVLDSYSVTFSEIELVENGVAKNVLSQPLTKTFPGFTLKKSVYYDQNFHFFRGFQLDGVLWSYANLYYAPDNTYNIRNSPEDGYKTLTDYWVFKRQFPLSSTSNGMTLDPCGEVYPGKWRMPTKLEAQSFSLTNTNSIQSYSFFDASGNSIQRDYDYVEFVNKIDQKIRFYAFGMRDGAVYSGEGVVGLFWLNSKDLRTQADVLRFTISSTGNSSSNGLIDYPDYVITSVRGLNIRCVRDIVL